jgi:hypothetical protein
MAKPSQSSAAPATSTLVLPALGRRTQIIIGSRTLEKATAAVAG